MAIFKILKGEKSRIDTEITPFHEGYAYFTPEDGGLYIDATISGGEKRIRVNSSLDDQAITFTEARTLSSLNSGATMSSLLGKLAKAVSDLIDHLTDNTSNPHGVTKAQVGLGNVPDVATNDQTPTYTVAATLANLTSGETISIAFGKIAKAITDLISHIGNRTVHITSAERTTWDAAVPSTRKINNKALSTDIILAPSDIGAAETSSYATVTLRGSGWLNNKQTVTISGMTSSKNGLVALSTNATSAQKTAAAAAGLSISAQNTNSLTISAITPPTIDIPIVVILLG